MPTKAMLDEQVIVKQKQADGDGAGEWVTITDAANRARIRPAGAETALSESSRLDTRITHQALVAESDEFAAGRLLIRMRDGANFRIEHVSPIGKRRHGGRKAFLRLLLWRIRPEIEQLQDA